MSSLGRDLAGADCDYVLSRTKVTAISLKDRLWTIATEEGGMFKAKCLIVTAPPPQGALLLSQAAPEAAEKLARITMAPCLAVAARYSRRLIPWHGIQCHDHSILSWIGHDSSKRQDLHPLSTVLVFHATAEFSTENFASDEAWLTEVMIRAASEIVGEDLSAPQTTFVQRWRYAMGSQAPELNQQIVAYAQPAKLVLAGDAMAGGKVEGAWLSGLSAAQHLKTCAL
jgi:predicted NAD/FAD-dependent oxidoreductase